MASTETGNSQPPLPIPNYRLKTRRVQMNGVSSNKPSNRNSDREMVGRDLPVPIALVRPQATRDRWKRKALTERCKPGVGFVVSVAGLGSQGPEFEPFFPAELTPGGLTQRVILPRLAK